MTSTKYGDHLIPANITQKEGEVPILEFAAAPYGVDASWVLLPVTKLKPQVEELPTHSHDFHQFITWIGADLKDISEFKAEQFICLGEEQERHIVNTPTILNLPAGTPHCPAGWLKVEKPIYHLDIFLSPDYAKTDVRLDDDQTSGTRYGKHLIPAPVGPAQNGPKINTLAFSAHQYGADLGWFVVPVLEPRVMEEKPHRHDFHQFFCFMGSNPENLNDFDAEIEVYLGDEGEKHVITSPTVLHISPGLMHCPMIYKKVNMPVLHIDIVFAPEYQRIAASRD